MEQLEMFQDNLNAKLNQMKAMQSELKTYQAQVARFFKRGSLACSAIYS